mgnify:FL=1
MHTSKSYMEAANAAVPRIPADEAVARHAHAAVVFVNVRDSSAIAGKARSKARNRFPVACLNSWLIQQPLLTTKHSPRMLKSI